MRGSWLKQSVGIHIRGTSLDEIKSKNTSEANGKRERRKRKQVEWLSNPAESLRLRCSLNLGSATDRQVIYQCHLQATNCKVQTFSVVSCCFVAGSWQRVVILLIIFFLLYDDLRRMFFCHFRLLVRAFCFKFSFNQPMAVLLLAKSHFMQSVFITLAAVPLNLRFLFLFSMRSTPLQNKRRTEKKKIECFFHTGKTTAIAGQVAKCLHPWKTEIDFCVFVASKKANFLQVSKEWRTERNVTACVSFFFLSLLFFYSFLAVACSYSNVLLHLQCSGNDFNASGFGQN